MDVPASWVPQGRAALASPWTLGPSLSCKEGHTHGVLEVLVMMAHRKHITRTRTHSLQQQLHAGNQPATHLTAVERGGGEGTDCWVHAVLDVQLHRQKAWLTKLWRLQLHGQQAYALWGRGEHGCMGGRHWCSELLSEMLSPPDRQMVMLIMKAQGHRHKVRT